MKVYKNQIVKAVENYYGDLLTFNQGTSVYQHLHKLSEKLWSGIKEHSRAVQYEINNYHPAYIGGNGKRFLYEKLDQQDARLTIAREYGFKNWTELKNHGKRKLNPAFEMSVEHLLNGNLKSLEELLTEHPNLSSERSKYGHHATLLHYTTTNGVEIWRQRVPENLPEISQCLLDYGADLSAKMYAYGGEFDTLALLESSIHPFDAGVGEEMLKILS